MAKPIIIFDYDGTLHNCAIVYKTAFLKVYDQLIRDGFAQPRTFRDEEISQWLGYSATDMWNTFMPQLNVEQQQTYSKLIGKYMHIGLQEGKARWYPHAMDVVKQLKQDGYPLILLSNCSISYMEAHKAYFGLQDLFVGFYPCERYHFIPKYEVFEYIKKEHPGKYIVVGDRFRDMELAKHHHLPSIGCLYGYGSDGELDCADDQIQDITELPSVLEKLKS